MSTQPSNATFGVIGLAVMGRNLALNLSDHGQRVAVYNREPELTSALLSQHPDRGFVRADDYAALAASLPRPRRLLIMVKAGAPVDSVLGQLAPHLAPDDVVIDGGNTLWTETERRQRELAERGVHFVGMGVSGGEEGARHGPSLMPGGTTHAWQLLRPILESIAATSRHGACVTHVGPGGAGHFVKMVHNGIEYGDMQLLAEGYDVLGRIGGLSAQAQADIFAQYNEGPLASFLIELTAAVLRKLDDETGKPLVELVDDRAGQKGTGRWTAQAALELGVAIPTIAAAIDARVLSAAKPLREQGQARLPWSQPTASPTAPPAELVRDVESALLFAKLSSYAQGMHLIQSQAAHAGWSVDAAEIARIWTAGCIIRAELLAAIMDAYRAEPQLPHLLFSPRFTELLSTHQAGARRLVALSAARGIPTPALSASLSYYDALRTARLPQNLTQAQRDAFGAHTYTRLDAPERGAVHSDWLRREP